MLKQAAAPWADPALQAVTGPTLRPGGFDLTDRAAGLAGVNPGWRVLDVGAGNGATVARLRARFGAQAFGLEPCAQQVAWPVLEGLPLARCVAEALPVRSGAVRMVLCECVLSLTKNPGAALAEFARVLEAGGVLALSDLYVPTLWPGAAGRRSASSCAMGAQPLDVIREMVREAGLTVSLTEDHTPLLRDLAAQLVFGGAGGVLCDCGTRRGYYLLLAHKPEGCS